MHLYLVATRYRKYVKKRDKGVCKQCSVVWKRGDKPWVADHVVPLHKVDRDDYPACLYYWSMDNLQTLCNGCSHVKTVAELKAIHAKPAPVVVPEATPWAYIYPSTGVTIDG